MWSRIHSSYLQPHSYPLLPSHPSVCRHIQCSYRPGRHDRYALYACMSLYTSEHVCVCAYNSIRVLVFLYLFSPVCVFLSFVWLLPSSLSSPVYYFLHSFFPLKTFSTPYQASIQSYQHPQGVCQQYLHHRAGTVECTRTYIPCSGGFW